MATDAVSIWTNDIQFGRKLKKPARAKGGGSASNWTGAKVNARPPSEYSGKGSKADVAARLGAIAKKSQQVMVKITGGGKTTWSIKQHMSYISRDGELAMVDQTGKEIQGADAVKDASWSWIYEGPQMDDSGKHKQAFNIVFSMPEGTDERAVYASARATAEVEYAGHQWVMVQHFDEPHVHVHIHVKAEAFDGQRLNPRKPDLQRWRERFAHELRERGVEAEATRRVQRLEREKLNKPWAVTRMEQRGEATHTKPSGTEPKRAAAWKKNEEQASASYWKLIESLKDSGQVDDRQLAAKLQTTLAAQSRVFREADPRSRAPEVSR